MKKLLVVLLMIGLVAAPAMAAEVTFSGAQVVQYTWTNVTYEDAAGDSKNDFGGYSSDGDGVLSFPKNGKSTSLIANWKASDSLSGVVTISQGANAGAKTQENAYFRNTYVKWNFGSGTMRFGYYDGSATNFVTFATGKDDDPWIFGGSFVMDRSAGMAFDFGGFTVELKENYGSGIGTYTDVDTLIPQIQLAYAYASKLLFIKASGLFQTWTVEDRAAEESMTVNAYAATLTGKVNLGPAYIGLGGWYAVNNTVADARSLTWGGFSRPQIIDDELINYTVMNITLAGGVQISPKLGINAGICYNSGTYDEIEGEARHTDYETNAFVNVKTNIGPILFTPEIGYNDKGEAHGVDLDKTLYVTAQFKVFW